MTGQSLSDAHLPRRPAPAPDGSGALSPHQANEVAYRFVARYYDHERIVPILRLLEAISWKGDHPGSDEGWAVWQACVTETLGGAPLPELPPPWDA